MCKILAQQRMRTVPDRLGIVAAALVQNTRLPPSQA